MEQRDNTSPYTAPPGPAPAPAAKASNKGALGCLLVGILLFGGCAAYFAIDGSSKYGPGSSDSGASSATQGAAPATSAPDSHAQRLADLDGDTSPVTAYQAALNALAPKCTQDETHIAGLGDAGYKDLVQNGVKDETRLSVLQHLDDSIPASMGKTDCTGILSAYLVLREQG